MDQPAQIPLPLRRHPQHHRVPRLHVEWEVRDDLGVVAAHQEQRLVWKVMVAEMVDLNFNLYIFKVNYFLNEYFVFIQGNLPYLVLLLAKPVK